MCLLIVIRLIRLIWLNCCCLYYLLLIVLLDFLRSFMICFVFVLGYLVFTVFVLLVDVVAG